MMSADEIELYEPINTLKPVDEGIWIVDGLIVIMAMYGTRTHKNQVLLVNSEGFQAVV
ncbi:hypothetical protein [Coleofasciculus sp. LEGE 07092]|uniref:hypothetical protein n=1 Tax=Coleofasciculus sp. LEGE 07092 TaxID=2777969 RepID=UPI001D1361DE|nr:MULTISPECIES: hypothetical protein [unclassified Coleofasciculus]